MKIRIKFTKEGTMKFIGHLDVMRYFQKVMRRADVDIRYSEGFSPHQIMSFASPLGVGMESRGEYVDIDVLSTDSSAEMLRRINKTMVDGTRVLSYRLLPDTAANAMSVVAAADYTVRFRDGCGPEDWDGFCRGLREFMNQEQIMITKKTKKGQKEMDLKPLIYELSVSGREIRMKIATGSAANIKPDLVIGSCLNRMGSELPPFALLIRRDEVYANIAPEGEKPQFQPLEDFGEDIE